MQYVKKDFSEGFVQLTVLLSLLGLQLDHLPALMDSEAGPNSALAQAPIDGHKGCFRSRRMLEEVRSLGSPRFHTSLSAWPVHLAASGEEGEEEEEGPGPLAERLNGNQQQELEDVRVEAESPGEPEHLAGTRSHLSSSLLLDDEPLSSHRDIDQWHEFLSASGFDDLDMEAAHHLSDLGLNSSGAISQNVSLHDAMMGRQTLPNSSHPGLPRRAPAWVSPPPYRMAENSTRNAMGGLDEAVFEQINLLGFGDTIDMQLLEELDSDSGLSLDYASRSPDSPSYSEFDGGSEAESATPSPAHIIPSELAGGVQHNHTYVAPSPSAQPDPDVEPTQDDVYTQTLHIPFSAADVVSMPMEAFLQILERPGLSHAQVVLLRNIRRRGKNKLAAQNCRKRKLDAISGLEAEVGHLGRQRERLLHKRAQHSKALKAMRQQVEQLSRDVVASLRDEQGRPLSPSRFTLQCQPDGRMGVQPRRADQRQPKSHKGKKGKRQ